MGSTKFTREKVGQFQALLDLGWSLSRVKQHFMKSNPPVNVSESYLSRIRSGKSSQNQSKSKKEVKRGVKPKLNRDRIRRLLKRVDNVNPPTQRELSNDYNVSQTTIHRVIKKSGRKLVIKPTCHTLPESTIEKRAKRSWPLYMRFRKDRWKHFITSDEAWIYLTKKQGQRDIQYLREDQDKSHAQVNEREQYPQGFMVWVAFSANHIFKPIYVGPGAKIDAQYYCDNVLEPFLKEYHEKYPETNMIFHQDSAPSHTSIHTKQFLDSKGIRYITKKEWMPGSPDAAPCDFFLWGYLKNKLKLYFTGKCLTLMTIQTSTKKSKESIQSHWLTVHS